LTLARLDLGNGATTTYAYYGYGDPWGTNQSFRLWRLKTVVNGTTPQIVDYGYDAVGNITHIANWGASEDTTYTYDALDRLTRAISMTNGYTGTYTYDSIGNLKTKTETGTPITYTYGVTQPHAVRSLTNGGQFTYDLNGNMTQRVEVSGTQRITYTQRWDAENRLIVVTNTASVPNLITRFVYDGDGNRVLQVAISGTQVVTTAYASALEVQITATQRLTKTYYSAGSQLIAMRQFTSSLTSTVYYLSGDHLGSTSAIFNDSGVRIGEMRYRPYGEIRYTAGMSPTNRQFTGQYNDAIGLMCFRARYYSGGLGRFVSADTIVPDGKSPQQFNRYSYGLNNPVKYTDPSGHMAYDGGDGGVTAKVLIEQAEKWKNDLLASNAPRPSWDSLPRETRKGLSLSSTGWSKTSWNYEFGRCDSSCPDVWAHHDLTGDPINAAIWTLGGMYLFSRIAAGAAVAESALSDTVAEAGTAPVINPGYPGLGRTLNCVNCAVATDSTFAGYPASALPSAAAKPISSLEALYGRNFVSVAGKAEIEAMLVDLGPGTRAIVYGSNGGMGHVFNAVVNNSGMVKFWDGQIGRAATNWAYSIFKLLVTIDVQKKIVSVAVMQDGPLTCHCNTPP
jgi:RHS repeat-associated protein